MQASTNLSASSPSCATCTSYPLCCRRNSIAATMFGSSSAIRIFLLTFGFRPGSWGSRGVLACRHACGQGKRKASAFPGNTLHPHPSAEMLDDLTADMQAEAAAVRLVGERVAHLPEFAEDCGLIFLADAPAVVAHIDLEVVAHFSQDNFDPAVGCVAEFHRVRQQVEHDLNHAVEVGGHRGNLIRQPRLDLDGFFLEQLAHCGQRVRDDLLPVDPGLDPVGLARLDLGHVEDLVDEPGETLGLLGDDTEEFLALA